MAHWDAGEATCLCPAFRVYVRDLEPLRTTLVRTVTIALLAGATLARWMGAARRWPLAALLVFWFSFGGHWVELWFLNWLRARVSGARTAQIVARVVVWFIGGIGLGLGAALAATLIAGRRPAQWPPWWIGGPAPVGLDLVVHLVLQLRGQASFYNGRG